MAETGQKIETKLSVGRPIHKQANVGCALFERIVLVTQFCCDSDAQPLSLSMAFYIVLLSPYIVLLSLHSTFPCTSQRFLFSTLLAVSGRKTKLSLPEAPKPQLRINYEVWVGL